MKKKLLAYVLLAALLSFAATPGCRQPRRPQDIVARVRLQAATVLKKDASEIEITKPLVAQGADDLAMVEIIMGLEDSFDVEISERSVGDKIETASKTLTVERLAQIVSNSDKRK
jgi:acyl carrier protein